VTGNYSLAIELALGAIGDVGNPQTNILFAWLVAAYSAIDNQEDARKWLAKIETVSEGTALRSISVALAHAAIGETDEFFTWARRALKEKDISFAHLRVIEREIPTARNIRQDPRFVELFKAVGLKA
jgi:hypothetical protein